ncbi:DinB family protein [Gordonia desulfuricans]|uniref:DinB family protein n=1 Tax=Gordonia desulfuricans TaxID=89051 RepID=A0A7K3LQF0_9ACTN|nr:MULTISPECIES: DinB family protein [Gordonia]EMP13660.1 chorismate synthase [Gordonia sp. NB41Y]NDK90448.1 DinB family protein [Gordonia desulfuricans]WLP91724.1 DinB family protein [Gordonia sp. NB41Y]
MRSIDVLADGLSRVQENVHAVLDGIDEERLVWQPAPGANTIAWLVWHVTRVQDAQVADVAGTEQVWRTGGWYERFALPFAADATGYGHHPDDVIRVVGPPDLLLGYHDETHAATLDYLARLSDADLDRIVDTRWDPPVTLGVRLVSIVDDDAQHIGQAAYLRGLQL